MATPAANTYARLQEAGLSGQPLVDATTLISNGDTTLLEVLQVVPAVTGTPAPDHTPIYQKLRAAGLRGDALQGAFEAVQVGVAIEEVLKVAAIVRPNPDEVTVTPSLQIIYQELEAVGLHDWQLDETAAQIAAGNMDLDEVLEIIASLNPLVDSLGAEGFTNEEIALILAVRHYPEASEIAEHANIEVRGITTEEASAFIKECSDEGLTPDEIVRMLRAVKARLAAPVEKILAPASEEPKAVASVERIFSLQTEIA